MSKRILVVDDEPDLIKVLTYRLEASGYEVLKALDGQEGLEIARQEKLDLILLDVMMPNMDGNKVCALLKFDKRYKNIPIIMLTARAEEEDRLTSLEIGADAFFNKPLNYEELLEKIKELIA